MFENLTERLGRALQSVRGQARLTDANIKDALREVRMALLEADVALPVVRDFIEQVRARAIGQEVMGSLTPGQSLIKVVRDELIAVMGAQSEGLDLNAAPPAVILLAGLQGSGKTTTVAKLARWVKEREKKSVLVVSADVYRPAAIQQLEVLAGEVGAEFFPSSGGDRPEDIAAGAIDHARRRFIDVLIVDTAGRLHVNQEMMDEIRRLHAILHPIETLFVVDAMTGQDAVNTARAFHEALALTGLILTKIDGDARGGAALSLRHVTGKPIKFLGLGEKTAALEVFHPDRIASRILGMGDMLSLIEEAERNIDRDKAEKFAQKIKRGKGFDLQDFREQLQQMRNMGGVAGLLDKLPGVAALPQAARDQVNDKQFIRMEAMINSMTPKERRFPDIINGSRKRRIAGGSGVPIQDLNRMLKQFHQMQKMMKRVSRGGMQRMMQGLKGKLPF